ncbi:hypothetical protein PIB30_009142 [Stylosanthes scabra]|uniref:Transmembrane protein n=1 Tax=Stylosanthes scabra TaxID=79078 RepID=A0ABU6X6S2_9FABA|nr:hypothetical protein [Stylosanthes scabra]
MEHFDLLKIKIALEVPKWKTSYNLNGEKCKTERLKVAHLSKLSTIKGVVVLQFHFPSQLFEDKLASLEVLDQVCDLTEKMESFRVFMAFTIYVMAMMFLVCAHCGVAESVVEDVAAIPPTPMESAGVYHGAQAVLGVAAFAVAWFI